MFDSYSQPLSLNWKDKSRANSQLGLFALGKTFTSRLALCSCASAHTPLEDSLKWHQGR